MGLITDRYRSLLNSILFIVKNFIPYLNIIFLLRRVNGVKGLIIIIIGSKI